MDLNFYETLVPVMQIWVEGEMLPWDVTSEVLSLRYYDDEEKMAKVEITILNRELELLDQKWFQEGNEVWVQWGYVGNMSPVYTAIIKTIEPSFGYKGPTIMVTAISKACVMAGAKYSGVWLKPEAYKEIKLPEKDDIHLGGVLETAGSALFAWYEAMLKTWANIGKKLLGYTPSEIAVILANHYGLKPKIYPTFNRQPFYQTQESDWDFLKRIAEKAQWGPEVHQVGCQFYVDGDEFHFRPKRNNMEPLMEFLYYVDNTGMLKEFYPEIDAQGEKGAGAESTAMEYDRRRDQLVGFMANKHTLSKDDKLGSETTVGGGTSGEKKMRGMKEFLADSPTTSASPVTTTHEEVEEEDPDPLKHRMSSGLIIWSSQTALDFAVQAGLDFTVKAGIDEIRSQENEAICKKQNAEMEELKAQAIVVGWPKLRSKVIADFQGIGTKYSGLYRVAVCVHVVGQTAYSCELALKRNATGTHEGEYSAPAEGVENEKEAKPQEGTGAEELVMFYADQTNGGSGGP